jgi:hypothetical protein
MSQPIHDLQFSSFDFESALRDDRRLVLFAAGAAGLRAMTSCRWSTARNSILVLAVALGMTAK